MLSYHIKNTTFNFFDERKEKEMKWQKLDNTAKIFPVIASENLTNVYRISVILKEDVRPEILEEALLEILPWFQTFDVRLRRGFFWYYFEKNKKKPKVMEEVTYPCRYLDPYANNQYLFRVTYYKKRINLEVFHAITDGFGAVNFLKELIYCYFDHLDGKKTTETKGSPSEDCFLNSEDSYLKHYKKQDVKGYETKRAVQLKGEHLKGGAVGVVHGMFPIEKVKEVSKKYGASITQYLTAVLIFSIYEAYYKAKPNGQPIRVNVPVNLRQYFESTTTRNFFGVIGVGMAFEEREYSFEEILEQVKQDFKEQLTKESLEKLISYNVSNEKKWVVRLVPLFVKNIAVKWIYRNSIKAFTTTLSNIGAIQLREPYADRVENVTLIMGASKKQEVKCGACSYGETMTMTFSSVLKDVSIQKVFYRNLANDGIPVSIMTNGIYYEREEE